MLESIKNNPSECALYIGLAMASIAVIWFLIELNRYNKFNGK